MRTYKFAGMCARFGDKVIDRVAIFIAILILLIGGYAIWDNFIASRVALPQEIMKYKPVEDIKSLEELSALNPDVRGWVTIKKTNIDHPVLQGVDNLEYLHKNAKKDFDILGSVFLDHKNTGDFSDRYNILYGHNVLNGAMFGDINKFREKKYFSKRKYGELTTFKEKYRVEIFACIETQATNFRIYNPELSSLEEMKELHNYVKTSAVQYRDIRIKPSDKIIAMSTCAEAETNGRVVLFARLTEVK